MADFEVDIEAFKNAIEKYKQAITSMNNTKKKLSSSVTILKNGGWKSDAGNKFFELYEKDWGGTIEQYTKVIGFLCDLLKEAETQYGTVVDESKKLKF
ncbi:WXG100 family type VII secretion target [Clostridium sp. UBA7503]|uniref:WXG100 family type VII secretion target n=1 Tax=Clostridium sp. UBA7503 TaxID=1946377 RepID=UPI003216D8DF